MSSCKDFVGKLALVTGGVTGIGHEICVELAQSGATVVVADLAAESAQKVASSLPSDGGRKHLGVAMDVSNKSQVEAGIQKILSTYGRPPELTVNSAGVEKGSAPIVDLKEADIDLVMNVNFKGTLLVCQAVGKALLEAGKTGSIVNIASLAADRPTASLAHYCASKAAVQQFTRVAAIEWGPKGIRVNGVNPGIIETPFTSTPFWAAIKQHYAEVCSLRRLGKPADVTSAVMFLLSDASSFITGHSLEVSGQRV